MTITEALQGINAYPIPLKTLWEVAESRNIDLSEEFTNAISNSKEYRLTKADIYLWLSYAPDISEGGQTFSFTDEQRKQFRNTARGIYAELEPQSESVIKPIYGYKGSKL